MATTIKLKNSVTTTNAPSSLVQGEVAINITDKKVWVGNAATTPIQLLGDGASASFGALSCTTLSASGVATFSAGTVSAPAITTTGDTNTGIYFPAADTIAFTEGGAEAMRIDSSGNVLVGTSSASYNDTGRGLIEINGSSSALIGFKTSNTNRGYVFNDGTDMSVYNAMNGYLRFGTNNTERMRIDSSGNVAIGMTPSTDTLLEVYGSAAATCYKNTNTGTGTSDGFYVGCGKSSSTDAYVYNRENAPVIFGSNNTERMRITSGGDVAIGSTSANNAKLYSSGIVASGSGFRWDGSSTSARGIVNTTSSLYALSANAITYGYGVSTNVAGGLDIMANQSGVDIRFYCGTDNSAPSERMRITSGGDLLVGTTTQGANQKSIFKMATSAAWPLTLDGNNRGLLVVQSASSGIAAYFTTSTSTVAGEISVSGSTTTYTTSSDYRLKENVEPMTDALAKVAQLKPCTYTWKADGFVGQGFIAHELQAVVPDAVVGQKDAVNEDGSIKPQGVDTSYLVATLTAAIQEQQAMIEELKAEVALLKSK